MDAKYRFPSAYSNPGGAETFDVARTWKYADFLWPSDPLADACQPRYCRNKAAIGVRACTTVKHRGGAAKAN